MKSAIAAACLGLLLAAVATPAAAQTIYPLNRAQILVGADFDLKVEFPGVPASADVKVTIDGEDAGQVLGKTPEIIANEDGLPQTAYWIRGARLATAGRHTVEAMAGSDKASVAWDAFATPEGRKAKNVILFIGDGLSMGHRTAARILSKGITEGRYGGEIAIDDMPYMALVSTAGTDSVITDSANSMTAYTTGHKSCVNALGVYCAKNLRALAHPKVETIAELAKRKLGLAVGVVTNTEIEDCNARRHGGPHPPALPLRRHRAHVLQGSARRHPGRRRCDVPAQALGPGELCR
jgi:alkaline phosphatase